VWWTQRFLSPFEKCKDFCRFGPLLEHVGSVARFLGKEICRFAHKFDKKRLQKRAVSKIFVAFACWTELSAPKRPFNAKKFVALASKQRISCKKFVALALIGAPVCKDFCRLCSVGDQLDQRFLSPLKKFVALAPFPVLQRVCEKFRQRNLSL
jgi:hypothetical protein